MDICSIPVSTFFPAKAQLYCNWLPSATNRHTDLGEMESFCGDKAVSAPGIQAQSEIYEKLSALFTLAWYVHCTTSHEDMFSLGSDTLLSLHPHTATTTEKDPSACGLVTELMD